MSNLNKHLIKAIDNYPYNLEECIEGLQYALSGDDNTAMALCLMGRIYAEQFQQYEEAKSCFQEAMAQDMNLLEIYPYFIYTLIQKEDYLEAEKLIEFAFTLKGINKAFIWWNRIYLLERQGEYKKALKYIDYAICESFCSPYISQLEEVETRIKRKKDLAAKRKKKSNE